MCITIRSLSCNFLVFCRISSTLVTCHSSIVNVLSFGGKEAKCEAAVRVQLANVGSPIGPRDTMIAGTALANGGVLVTRNTREFKRVAGLRLENWFRSLPR